MAVCSDAKVKEKLWSSTGKPRVIVGLSGGVDSSVAAAELLEQGYDVVGLFMKNWEEDDNEVYCSAAVDLADAQSVCKTLGIGLQTANFSHEYWGRVFEYFLAEYRRGRTPNPDVLCNKEIKFKQFLDWAMDLGADKIATGHYAQIRRHDGHFQLIKGADPNKDQTYFLYTLGQAELSQSLFPIGSWHKSAVRKRATELGLAVDDKKDSTGICFIGERRFRDFLKQFLPAKPGQIQTLDGDVIGEHIGAMYFTIGQRSGLGVGGVDGADEAPWYVADKDVKANVLYVVQGHDHPALFKQILLASQGHWVSGIKPDIPLICKAKTRYRQVEQRCTIRQDSAQQFEVVFDQAQRAITPGQSIVFYQAEQCLGGGIIEQGL